MEWESEKTHDRTTKRKTRQNVLDCSSIVITITIIIVIVKFLFYFLTDLFQSVDLLICECNLFLIVLVLPVKQEKALFWKNDLRLSLLSCSLLTWETVWFFQHCMVLLCLYCFLFPHQKCENPVCFLLTSVATPFFCWDPWASVFCFLFIFRFGTFACYFISSSPSFSFTSTSFVTSSCWTGFLLLFSFLFADSSFLTVLLH